MAVMKIHILTGRNVRFDFLWLVGAMIISALTVSIQYCINLPAV